MPYLFKWNCETVNAKQTMGKQVSLIEQAEEYLFDEICSQAGRIKKNITNKKWFSFITWTLEF